MSAAVRALWDVPGQARAVHVLRGAVARAEVGHAWALVGPPGVGQAQAARALAAALNCPAPAAPGEPCGTCQVCERCSRGAYGAYLEFTATGAFHRVDDVRERWLRAASRTPAEGRWQVLHVRDADRMNDASANAFLKGLEEPPPHVVWVLDIADPDELPDTILSRCRTLRLVAWGPDELDAEALRLGIDDPAERALAVRVALGSPATLERLAVPAEPAETTAAGKVKRPARPSGFDDLRAHRELLRRLRADGQGFALVAAYAVAGRSKRGEAPSEVERWTAGIEAAGAAQLADLAVRYGDEVPRGVAKELEERTTREVREARTKVVATVLDDLLVWLRDCLLVSSGADVAEAIHRDDPDGLRADAAALGPAGIIKAIDLVLATRELLERNVQQTLALEALFLQLSALALARRG